MSRKGEQGDTKGKGGVYNYEILGWLSERTTNTGGDWYNQYWGEILRRGGLGGVTVRSAGGGGNRQRKYGQPGAGWGDRKKKSRENEIINRKRTKNEGESEIEPK